MELSLAPILYPIMYTFCLNRFAHMLRSYYLYCNSMIFILFYGSTICIFFMTMYSTPLPYRSYMNNFIAMINLWNVLIYLFSILLTSNAYILSMSMLSSNPARLRILTMVSSLLPLSHCPS